MEHSHLIADFEQAVAKEKYSYEYVYRDANSLTISLELNETKNAVRCTTKPSTNFEVICCTIVDDLKPYKKEISVVNTTVPLQDLREYLHEGTLHLRLLFRITGVTSSLPQFNDSKYSDVRVLVGTKTFYLHKCIVCKKSSVFKTMLQAGMTESLTNEIRIDEFNEECVENCLRYMYQGVGALRITNPETWYQLWFMANKYDLKFLQQQAEETLGNSATEDNLIELLQFALQHECSYMKHLALKKMKNKLSKNCSKRKFLDAFGMEDGMDLLNVIMP